METPPPPPPPPPPEPAPSTPEIEPPPPVAMAHPIALYIGDLQPGFTEGALLELFCKEDGLDSIRLCRDTHTGRSLGYGYVNFKTTETALQAIEKFNHRLIDGKPVRMMMSCRDADGRKSGIGNLFVKNLVDSVNNEKLHEVFAEYGAISSCKVAISPDGRSKGYGFVQYETQEAADTALEKLNGRNIGGKQIYVSHFIKRSERAPPTLDAKYTNLYMKNLDQDISEELLRLKFSEFGKITNLAISVDANGNSKGFAFVNFENPDDARRALETMNGVQLGSKSLYVARAQKKAERQQFLQQLYEERKNERIRKNMASNLYVKNIEDGVTDDEFRNHFGQYGNITSSIIMRNEKGISKGFGFVCFSSPVEAIEAVKALHGNMFHGKPLYVAFAQRKEDRQAQLQIHFAQLVAGYTCATTAVVPPGVPVYYSPPPGALPQLSSRPGFMYPPPMGMRPGWRPNGFIPHNRPVYPPPMSLPVIPNNARQHRQNRTVLNGHILQQNGHPMPYTPHLQPNLVNTSKNPNYMHRPGQTKYMPNGRPQDLSNGPAISQDMLSSMLAAATPRQQKQILGEQLFPLIQRQKRDQASKITGMLLEMDNSELLLLLDSPESLIAKVNEAIQVLELAQAKGGNQEAVSSKFLSSEVSVN